MSQFSFGGDNAIFQLASQVGANQRFQQQAARDQQLVQSIFDQRVQRDAIALEKEKLRFQAQAQRTNMTQTPTPSRSFNTPFTRSVEEANQTFKQPVSAASAFSGPRPQGEGTISGGGSTFSIRGDELSGEVDGRQLAPSEIRRRSNFVSGRPEVTGSPLTQFKRQFIENFPNLDPQLKRSLEPFVVSDEVDLNDLAVRINQFSPGPARNPQTDLDLSQQLRLRERAIRDEADDIESELDQIGGVFEDADVNVLGRRPEDTMRAIQDAFRRSPEEGARLQTLVARREELLQRRQELRSTQQGLFQEQIQQFQRGTQLPPPDVRTPDRADTASDDDIKRILGL
jgi:hypothetical protein